MKVKVLPGAGMIVCDGENFLPGDAFEISDKEGKRLIEAGLVESVAGRPKGSGNTSGEGDQTGGEAK